MLGIIGGSGLNKLTNLEITRREVVRTPYGEPSGALTFGKINGHEVVFLARHGYGHILAPHEVNYRANLWALHSQNVTNVIAIASVGGIRADMVPGALAIPHQIIDYTYGRKFTYFEGSQRGVVHIDFTHPYCPVMRARCAKAAELAGESIIPDGVYAATQGPRLESAAEINRLERDGANMVGMTGMPEASLAKEINLSYATLAVVANYAAGRGTSSEEVKLLDVSRVLEQAMVKVRLILERLVELDGD